MVYRPTVRYSEDFREYIDQIFKSTHLDRNQILRLALFVAAHSNEYKTILSKYKKPDVLIPSPIWRIDEESMWRDNNYIRQVDSSVENEIKENPIRLKDQGGIKLVF
ncbi:hypothetical protein [Metabacillus litoralis]|uniref:hypothetical protein n=1 Tax=Metabacillus litoralis TaxID=152268 RepID=UPI002040F428|nr:hypothetical protein [Metabacillus litoralis]MCM3411446.1 hypothetical protein [Metabacillus litoralis]